MITMRGSTGATALSGVHRSTGQGDARRRIIAVQRGA